MGKRDCISILYVHNAVKIFKSTMSLPGQFRLLKKLRSKGHGTTSFGRSKILQYPSSNMEPLFRSLHSTVWTSVPPPPQVTEHSDWEIYVYVRVHVHTYVCVKMFICIIILLLLLLCYMLSPPLSFSLSLPLSLSLHRCRNHGGSGGWCPPPPPPPQVF